MQQKVLTLCMRSEAATSTKSPHPLERAALENDYNSVSQLIKNGFDINTRFAKGWTALHVSSAHNYPDFVGALLDHDADPELCLPDGSTPLHISATKGHHKVTEILLRHGARPDAKREPDGLTPLHLAAASAKVDTVKILLDAQEKYGMDIDQPSTDLRTALQCACEADSLECLKLLISAGAKVDVIVDSKGRTPLMSAATTDNDQITQTLLDAGANINSLHSRTGMTAVMIASFSGNLKVLNTLISGGANLDVMDKNQYTPLRAAIEGKQSEAAMILLRHRIKINTIYGDHHTTALHLAVSRSMHNVAELIIQKGADIEARDSDGDTPLQWAVEKGDVEMCKTLTRYGAQVNARNDKTGDVLLHWAIRSGHVSVTELLLENKAEKSLVDLAQLKKSDSAEEEDFELCKILVDTAPSASDPLSHFSADQADPSSSSFSKSTSPATHVSEHVPCTEDVVSAMSSIGRICPELQSTSRTNTSSASVRSSEADGKSFAKNPSHASQIDPSLPHSPTDPPSGFSGGLDVIESRPAPLNDHIRHQIWDIPGQVEAAEKIIPILASELEHSGVTCDGPLCEGKPEYIKGVRFKCMFCENIDFCLACVSSFHNQHHGGHAMIRCLLPNNFCHMHDIDDNAKIKCVEAYGEPSVTVEDLIHIVYGSPEIQGLRSEILSKAKDTIDPKEIARLLPDPSQFLLPVINPPRGYIADIRKRGIMEDRDDRTGGVRYYKIDEVGNVRVKQYHQDDDSTKTPREDGLLMHHQDVDLQVKAMMGELKLYDYAEEKKFYQWANERRLVTRLVDIMPGGFDDKIQIGIRVVDLNTNPDYMALSYTWKETTYERAIKPSWPRETVEATRKIARFLHAVYCNSASGDEQYLEINAGLRDALKRIRHKSDIKTYWIDQISINQKHPKERSLQVSGMQVFFNRAKQVTLWVGEDEEDTFEVFTILQNIAEEFRRQGYAPHPDQMATNCQSPLPSFSSSVWISVLNLFDRPVFNRCWVVQEVVSARNLVLYCGKFSIAWPDFSMVAETLSQRCWLVKLPQDRLKNKYTGLLPSPSDPHPQDIEVHGFTNVVIMNGLREGFHAFKRTSLTSLLYSTFQFEASDPRDKIYSMLGIRKANSRSNYPHQLEADYEKPIDDVFLHAAKVCIMEDSSFAICGINSGRSSKKLDQIPSWVPDLTTENKDSLTSLCRPDPFNPYHACGQAYMTTKWPYESRPDLLVTSSCKIDTIVSVSDHFMDDMETLHTVIVEWTRMASHIGPNYPTGEFVPDVFCRTCVADVSGPFRHSPMPKEFHIPLCRVFETCFHRHLRTEVDSGKSMDAALADSSNAVIATLMTDVFRMDDASHSDEAQCHEDCPTDASVASQSQAQISALYSVAVEAMFLACKNRRFFVTENNFMGFSCKDLQAGDEVHVLGGTSVPFVLRKAFVPQPHLGGDSENGKVLQAMRLADEDGLRSYQMVGEGYIHGFMQGQISAREGAEWNEICIF